MGILGKLKTAFISLKIIAQRVGSYLNIVNLSMIVFLTLSNLQDKGFVKWNIGAYLFPIYFAILGLALLFGYLEAYVFKGVYKETELAFKISPIHPELQEMKKKIDEMYESYKGGQNGIPLKG